MSSKCICYIVIHIVQSRTAVCFQIDQRKLEIIDKKERKLPEKIVKPNDNTTKVKTEKDCDKMSPVTFLTEVMICYDVFVHLKRVRQDFSNSSFVILASYLTDYYVFCVFLS